MGLEKNLATAIHSTSLINEFSKIAESTKIYCFDQNKLINLNSRNIKKFVISKSSKIIFNKILYLFYSTTISFYLLMRKRIDVIYIRHGFNSIIGVILSKIFRKKLILEVNGISENEAKSKGVSRLKIFFIKINNYCAYKNSSLMIAVNQGIRQNIIKKYAIKSARVLEINNGVDIDLFYPMDKNTCKKKLELDENKKYLCFIGRLYVWQGIDVLISAMEILIKTFPNIHCLIVGGEENENILRQKINKKGLRDFITVTGLIDHDDVPLYINSSEICILPKLRINGVTGFSLKFAEYLACSKPLVSSNLTEFKFLEENNAGLLFDEGDFKDLAKKVKKLLNDKKLCNKLGTNGFKMVINKYTWNSVAKKTISAIAKRRSSDKIKWNTKQAIKFKNIYVPVGSDVKNQINHDAGIKKSKYRNKIIRGFIFFMKKQKISLLTDGFIKRTIGMKIKKFSKSDSVFLDVGCGDMEMKKFIPYNLTYNCLDLALRSETAKKIINNSKINFCLASLYNLPILDCTVSHIIATEVFEHIPDLDKAISELKRISKKESYLFCTIPNNYSYKYQVIGKNPEHINEWTFKEFQRYMSSKGYICLWKTRKGLWLSFTKNLYKTPIQLGFSSSKEKNNTNFFYVFKLVKNN